MPTEKGFTLMYKNKRKILYTFFTLTLIIILQSVTSEIGQFWADMLTDFLLIAAVMALNPIYCAVTAFAAPFLQKLLGLTVLPVAVLSAISISNILFITVYTAAFQIFASRTPWQKYFTWGLSVLVSSFLKFAVGYFAVEKLLMKILEINSYIDYSFGFTQLYYALAAGFAAMLVIYPLKKKLRL